MRRGPVKKGSKALCGFRFMNPGQPVTLDGRTPAKCPMCYPLQSRRKDIAPSRSATDVPAVKRCEHVANGSRKAFTTTPMTLRFQTIAVDYTVEMCRGCTAVIRNGGSVEADGIVFGKG